VYRRFCRIDGGKVPDAKTMVRLGQVIDGPTLQQLLRRLVTIATAHGSDQGQEDARRHDRRRSADSPPDGQWGFART
jgi:hypothetical protein